MSEFASSGNHLCVYVSQDANPVSSGWYLYDFQTTNFPDYPKYAVWPDAYYVSTNENDPAAYALDREKMLLGLPATSQRFTAPDLAGFPFQALIPSDLDGATLPPAGSPNYFMRHRDDEVHNLGSNDPSQDFLEIWEFHVDFAVPANSSFAKLADVAVSEFDSDLCGLSSFFCFPQPGTTTTLDPLREVVMWRLQYRNFESHETLVGNLVTDVDGTDHGGIRWFELRRTVGGPWALFQEGTVAPDQHHRWMGSIAMDGSGNIALGYSVSSSTVYPGIRYTGRLASDPAGTMPQGEHTIIDGAGYQSPSTRWGDYSAMSVDPADDCTFWYTNEYLPANGLWQTRIATFRFSECGDPDFTLDAEPSELEVCAPEVVTSTIQVGQVLGYDHDVTLEVLEVPAGVTAGIVPTVVTPPGEAELTLDVGSAAADGSHMLTISGTGEVTNVKTVAVELAVSSGPQVSLTSDAPVELGRAVHYTAEVPVGTPPLAYMWEFGGAGEASGEGTATPVFTYTEAGSYTATVTVTNGCGVAEESVGVGILCYEPEAALVTNSPVKIGEALLVTATLSGTAPLSYTWSFGGEGVSAGLDTLTPVYTYTNPGDYVVGLEVTGPCGAGTVTETVTAEPLRYYIYLPLVHR
jgi:PKD repeat protein